MAIPYAPATASPGTDVDTLILMLSVAVVVAAVALAVKLWAYRYDLHHAVEPASPDRLPVHLRAAFDELTAAVGPLGLATEHEALRLVGARGGPAVWLRSWTSLDGLVRAWALAAPGPTRRPIGQTFVLMSTMDREDGAADVVTGNGGQAYPWPRPPSLEAIRLPGGSAAEVVRIHRTRLDLLPGRAVRVADVDLAEHLRRMDLVAVAPAVEHGWLRIDDQGRYAHTLGGALRTLRSQLPWEQQRRNSSARAEAEDWLLRAPPA